MCRLALLFNPVSTLETVSTLVALPGHWGASALVTSSGLGDDEGRAWYGRMQCFRLRSVSMWVGWLLGLRALGIGVRFSRPARYCFVWSVACSKLAGAAAPARALRRGGSRPASGRAKPSPAVELFNRERQETQHDDKTGCRVLGRSGWCLVDVEAPYWRRVSDVGIGLLGV